MPNIRNYSKTINSIETYLKQQENKDLLKFITCGSVDDGKSTLIGRLLYDSKLVFEDHLNSAKNDYKKYGNVGNEDIDLALLVDGLQSEREQGITIDVAYRYFSTEKRKYIIADTPGHEQYTRNMVTGASNADLAVILIDAEKGILTQTKRHSFIVSFMGIKNILVSVNKMDLVNYDENIFNKIVDDYKIMLESLKSSLPYDNFKQQVDFIPVSALKGDNVVETSTNMKWFNGLPLMKYLDNVEILSKNEINTDFRFPVQYVNRPHSGFRGYCGTITSGHIQIGDEITVLPSRKSTKVKSIVTYDGDLDIAFKDMAVTLTTENEIDISRGNLLVKSDDVPEVGDCFDALIVWMNEEKLTKNKLFDVKRGTTLISGFIDEIYHKIDINTMKKVSTENLVLNEIACCRINLSNSIAFDEYIKYRHTGSFILIDRINNGTCGAGVIIRKQQAKNVIWHEHRVSKSERIKLKGHKPAVLWLTGLSGSGKSTIANALEDKLNEKGIHTYLLDGDNVRHGLNKDLGFSDKDRSENIRRIGELAKLFTDAGLIVITAFISPFKKDRNIAKNIIDDEFIEVYIDAPLDICKQRDPKGLYKKAMEGKLKGFTGIDSPYEIPEYPEIHIKSNVFSVSESVQKIIKYLEQEGII